MRKQILGFYHIGAVLRQGTCQQASQQEGNSTN